MGIPLGFFPSVTLTINGFAGGLASVVSAISAYEARGQFEAEQRRKEQQGVERTTDTFHYTRLRRMKKWCIDTSSISSLSQEEKGKHYYIFGLSTYQERRRSRGLRIQI